MTKPTAINVQNLGKIYGLPLPDWMLNAWHRIRNGGDNKQDNNIWALQNLNLQVEPGETLGIIGRNGAGKSTLLKILAGVTPPSCGKVEITGKLFAMIELNAGIHPELTGRENVQLLAAVMGISGKEIRNRISKIQDFCELGSWFEKPVRMYSSGMQARLGFAVALNVDAEILMIDEVLAVGDLAFQRKCYNQISSHQGKQQKTVLLVSHNVRQVERICKNALWLEQGQVREHGPATEVCEKYHKTAMEESAQAGLNNINPQATWTGSGEIIICEAKIIADSGEVIDSIPINGSARIVFTYKAKNKISSPIIGLGIYTVDMLPIANFGDSNASNKATLKDEGEFSCHLPLLPLLPGIYSIGITIKSYDNCRIYHGFNLCSFSVPYDPAHKRNEGVVYIKANWQF